MSNEHREKPHSAWDTERLLEGIEPLEGDEFSLDAILAEFGQGGAKPVPKPVEPVVEPSVEPEPEPEIEAIVEPAVSIAEPVAPVEEPVAKPMPPVSEKTEVEQILSTISKIVDIPREAIVEATFKEDTKPQKEEPFVEEIFTDEPAVEEEPAAEEESIPQAQEIIMDRDPGEPEGNINDVSLEQVMSRTVESVLEQDDEILEVQPTLRERLVARFAAAKENHAPKAPTLNDTEELWDHPENEIEEEPDEPREPEPDMEQADREEKQHMKKLRRSLLIALLPTFLLVVLSVLNELITMPAVWRDGAMLRCGLLLILLVLTAVICADVWKEMLSCLLKRRIGCETAACLATAVAIADCIHSCVTGKSDNLPLAAVAAVMICLCQYGLLLEVSARRAGFHLANLGGTPPYVVSQTAAGACKQKGMLEGFYHTTNGRDPVRTWQTILEPLLLVAATVLSAVVCLSHQDMDHFLWVWSAMLSASIPLSLPLTLSLPLNSLATRLSKSGSAVAGYQGAKTVSRSRRMVLTDNDIFPPGTVGLNGLKVFGEEISKVSSYAATLAGAAGSQLTPLFDQLLANEGGVHMKIEDLHFYEEGGVGGTIHGETVTMGSAYFMKKSRVLLPRDVKLKTGVYLAVDSVLVAIFAIKYQPSRNVEWALRALRRNRIEPVLAVRGGNITPALLKRKFNLDVKPVYPDVSSRLALSDVCKELGEAPNAIIYREGLMPFAETVIGSRRMVRTVKTTTILSYIGGVCGLLLSYYLTSVGNFGALSALYMLIYLALWLLPTWLLSGLVKHY